MWSLRWEGRQSRGMECHPGELGLVSLILNRAYFIRRISLARTQISEVSCRKRKMRELRPRHVWTCTTTTISWLNWPEVETGLMDGPFTGNFGYTDT